MASLAYCNTFFYMSLLIVEILGFEFGWYVYSLIYIYFCFLYFLQSEIECAYYLRTGQCKFGGTCKFHHPQPTNMMVSLRGSPVYPTVQSPTTPGQQSYPGGITNWSRASFIPSPRWQAPSSYTPLILPQGVVSVPGWNTYSVSLYSTFWALTI